MLIAPATRFRVQSNGDMEAALDFLRKKGMATAAKKVSLFCQCGSLAGVARVHGPGQAL